MKQRTFKSVDHSAPVGEVKLEFDPKGVIAAISEISKKLDAIKLEAPRVEVSVPEHPAPTVTVNVPEIVPHITVAPAEVVIQSQNGAPIQPPIIHVNLPIKPVCVILSCIPVLMIVEMVLLYFRIL